MNQERLRKPGFGERLRQLGYLFKHTFTLVGRDPGIVRPLARMSIYGAVTTSVFFCALLAFGLDADGTGIALLLAAIGLFIYKFFYYNRQELRQSWLAAETLQGRKRSAAEAAARVDELAWTARKLALIDMLVARLAQLARGEKAGFLVRIVAGALVEVWDLVNHYLLPAAAVDGLGIRDGVARMHKLRDNVPETLAGVFGIDIAARAVGAIMGPVYLLLVVGSGALGLWIGNDLPAFHVGGMADLLGRTGIDVDAESLYFAWLPTLIALWIGKLGSVVLERTTTTVKVIYFTVFYMRITHGDAIIDEIRGELDSYLRMEADDVEPVASPA
ncbi:MAG: hypothetical protein CMP07_13535 [Xanthomonadales bacterium]|nr:hypothetical protein [Xanthomonadales bacterium]